MIKRSKAFDAGTAVSANMQKMRPYLLPSISLRETGKSGKKKKRKMRSKRTIIIVLAALSMFSKATDLNSDGITMTALHATRLTPIVGERLRLNYTLETKVSVLVECFKGSEPTSSYYVLVPGQDSVSLNSSLDISSTRLRDTSIYVCQAGLIDEGPSASLSWSVDMQPKLPAYTPRDACTELDAHSCAEDRCSCASSNEAFFSKKGRRQCRLQGVLTLTARIRKLPNAISDPLEIGYYLVTYGDTFVYWITDRLERKTVSKVFVDGHRRVFNGVYLVRRHDFMFGKSLTAEACLSGTHICKGVELDMPKKVSGIGDSCANDAECSRVNGFCLKDVCTCTDSTGKEFGRSLEGVCTLSCADHRSCRYVKHSFCFAGVCECSAGYHFFNRTCLPDRCTADADCPANETCVSGSCHCLPGYVVEDANCKAAECLSNRDCFWKNSECVSGRCTCRVGCSIIAGECDRKTFGHCSQGCDFTVPNGLCGEKPWCTCKPGYVYRDQDGVASCVAIQCSRLSLCQDHQRQCVDYQCVCANTSRPCDWNEDLALQIFKEEGAVYKTVVLFLGSALTFILVTSVPVVVLQKVRACGQSGASCVVTTEPLGSERAQKRPYPFEAPLS